MTDEELNSRIAIEIMGWELLTIGYFYTREETPRQTELEGWLNQVGIQSIGDYWINVESSFWMESDKWNPVTDIAQAWQVLEKFAWPDYHKAVFTRKYAWCCDIQKSGGKLFAESAETAPMAICLASLKTLTERD